MRVLGTRRQDSIKPLPSGGELTSAASLLRTASVLAAVNTTGIPKGVYRFSSHEDANRHADESLSRAIAENLRARTQR